MTSPTVPPLHWRIAYRVLGLRLPDEYRDWVARDVNGPFFLAWRIGRTVLWLYAGVGLFWVGVTAMYQPPARRTVLQALLATFAVALLSSGKALMRRALRWQRIDRHGRPVAPRGLARLGNAEALVGGTAFVVFFAGAMALLGYGLRPTGPAGEPCRSARSATLGRIRSGLKDGRTELRSAQEISFRGTTMVAALVRPPGAAEDRAGVWVIRNGVVNEIRTSEQAAESTTTFQAPESVDTIGVEALRRVVMCLQRARGR